jgi:hypothetical protein
MEQLFRQHSVVDSGDVDSRHGCEQWRHQRFDSLDSGRAVEAAGRDSLFSSRGTTTFFLRNVAAPRLGLLQDGTQPSADALGHVDVAAPRLRVDARPIRESSPPRTAGVDSVGLSTGVEEMHEPFSSWSRCPDLPCCSCLW